MSALEGGECEHNAGVIGQGEGAGREYVPYVHKMSSKNGT